MKPVYLISDIIGAYGIVFVNFAIAVLTLKKKRSIHFLSAALLSDFGFMCIAGSFSVRTGYAAFWPNFFVFVPMVLLSPIGSAFAVNCLGQRKPDSLFLKALHSGALAIYAVCAVMLAVGASWLSVFFLVYGWLFFTFLSLAVFEGIELRPIRGMPAGLRYFYISIWLDVLLIAAMFVAHALRLDLVLYSSWVVLIFSLLGCTFIAFRSPETYRLIEEAASAIKYERSSLANVDIPAALAKLRGLMDGEHLFRNPDLMLEDLARKMGITPNQLSELINQRLELNFAGYVNRLRIDYAKRRLESDAERSVIAIAFESGFNSKSAFNAAFKKETDITPSDFRIKCAPSDGSGAC
jgi:AraC-like DNA-binding protein